jgi:predicted ribosome quality control (RQC) complex YloA/Tae2 family protein
MNKLVEEAPYHPGYEDAVVSPAPKYKGVDPAKMIWKNDALEKELEHYKNKAEYLDKRELELLAKIRKYEEVLHAIANDYHELSNHKIEVQVRNHKKWAREVLE